jgi:sigma-B regulation protein RsbU (phosphoserine phosphatase)
MTELTLKNKYEIKELELNALLEVTQAINNNVPEDSIYKIFNFTLRSNLNIKKLALFVLDDDWQCKVNFGTQTNYTKVILPDYFKSMNGVSSLKRSDENEFGEFDIVIPVAHKRATLALVFIGGFYVDDSHYDSEDALKFIQALSNIIIVAVENKKLARKQLEQEALRKELEIASDVQQFLFPKKLPNTEILKVEASYLPHDRIGGDYYDYVPINQNQFLICVADVSGKGIPAALMMSNFQASLRTLLRQTPNLTDVIEGLNDQVLENAKGEKFITFFAAIYDVKLKSMVYVNAGHNPPFLIDRKNGLRLLEEGSTVLGALHPLPFINEGFISDLDEFLLFCYTDGVTETINEDGNEYGSEVLLEYFKQEQTYLKDLKTIHSDIIISLDLFKGRNGYHDDITMLSCRVG